MSNEIKAAIRATLAATKQELAEGKASPELQRLTEKAIEAAEKVAGDSTPRTNTQRRRPA